MAQKRRRSSRKEWDPRKPPWKWQQLAEEAVAHTSRAEFAYRGDLPLGKTWAFTFSQSRDSGIVDVSNFETIKEDLEKRFPDDVSDECFSHWAVGWMDHLLVRLLEDDGTVTPAGIAALEWQEKLDNYPVADEEDVSRREYGATIENIQQIGGVDEVNAPDVYRWLSDNEPEELEIRDDGGAWPNEEAVHRALVELGLEEPEEEDEEEEPEPTPSYEHPGQVWFWPEMKPQLEEEAV